MKPVEPILTVELFPPLSRELLGLLKGLSPAGWASPTACGDWSVKDVAAHLLGSNLGRLSSRDVSLKPSGEPVISFDELVSIIDRENALWVQAARRISPAILMEFLDLTDGRLYEYFKSLKPGAPARIAVSWAGDSSSPNWFDIAREYTEKWLHQQHIREAIGRPLLTERQWLFPVLDTFLRALPHHYRNVEAPEGTSIAIQVTGEAGGEWTLVKQGADWHLFAGHDPGATARIVLDQDLAWRLFTKGINVEDAGRQVKLEGDPALAKRVLDMISIMA
jgi:uncharacterized protein (TIGR03083 family)